MDKKRLKIRFKSITMRWAIEVYLIIVAAVVLIGVLFSVVTNSAYIDRVKIAADNYAQEFSSLSNVSSENFESAAVSLAENFSQKNKIEVQVINNKGNAFVSTTGFGAQQGDMPDYKMAGNSADHIGLYNGKSESGERILAKTTLILNKDGKTLGAVRWIVSLERLTSATTTIIVGTFLVAVLILTLSAFSGIFFVKSIVNPIRDVSNTARKIATGNFEEKIEVTRNDEIGELCDAVNYMAHELKNAESLKSDFISSVSHELRTPLTAIRGWGETAKMSVGSDDELVNRGLEVVLSEADRLSGLVEELLDFSRMQTGRLKVVTSPIDVTGLMKTVTDMYMELSKKQGVEISYMPPDTEDIVMGDKDRLKQVFINIIDNAVKYTESGGLVLVTQTRADGCVQFQIKDTGVGIAQKDIEHVKEKFYKANNTVRGSGIGLAVADEIIKQHQGLLLIESKEGVGTTVTVALPLYEPPIPETLNTN